MEDHAIYQSAPRPPDLRDLIAPLAAWLSGLGFEVECAWLPGVEGMELLAGWHSPTGSVFHLMVVAQTGQARCRVFELVGTREHVLWEWVQVAQASEVQWLLGRNLRLRKAATEAGGALSAALLLGATSGPPAPGPVPAAPACAAPPVVPPA